MFEGRNDLSNLGVKSPKERSSIITIKSIHPYKRRNYNSIIIIFQFLL